MPEWLYENEDYKFGYDTGPSTETRYKWGRAVEKLREKMRARLPENRFYRRDMFNRHWKPMSEWDYETPRPYRIALAERGYNKYYHRNQFLSAHKRIYDNPHPMRDRNPRVYAKWRSIIGRSVALRRPWFRALRDNIESRPPYGRRIVHPPFRRSRRNKVVD